MSGPINRQYFESVVYGLSKSFWDERGSNARYRTLLVGLDYFLQKGIDVDNLRDTKKILSWVKQLLQEEGIVDNIEFSLSSGYVDSIDVSVMGCVHLPIEHKLLDAGAKPLVCPCINLLMHLLDRADRVSTELTLLEVDAKACNAKVVLVPCDFEGLETSNK